MVEYNADIYVKHRIELNHWPHYVGKSGESIVDFISAYLRGYTFNILQMHEMEYCFGIIVFKFTCGDADTHHF